MLPWPPLIHVHFFARGYPFAWVICGPDPAPARPSVPARLLVLGIAVAVHVSMSRVIYAGVFPAGVGPVDRRRGAMYYGGDLVELALAGRPREPLAPRPPRTPNRHSQAPR